MKISTLAALLGLALLAAMVMPTSCAPTPTNCMLESMGVDSDKLGGLLNVILSIVIQLLYSDDDDPCKQKELMGDMEDAMGDMMCFMDDQSEEGKGLLEALLGPLLKAVESLLQGLLGSMKGGSGGLLGAVGDLLSQVINLVVCLLNSLGLDVDVNLMLKLGNLLNLDLSALLNLG
ncbi:uncharacterized protein LOC124353892 isoform X4 [Homalodisca vitripennis]|uniref:uncharacterized protein LOC124353892 isoform X4 n=1 Tax=Homalodisca vitripennis TaxID=197043 RepID=UPI001EEA70BA|nr:uncharacterized protein LOC124353892 isoform X4 [Homalodisca vitripennis]